MRGALVIVMCGAAACASGTSDHGNPDAARADASQGPDVDAPAGTPDAPSQGTPDAADPADANVDAMTADAMPPPDAGTLGTGDTCAAPNDISGQTSFTFNGDLTGLANDIEPSPSCTGFDNDGPDAIFVVTAAAGKTINASVTTSWDSSIEILSQCAVQTGCVAGSDASVGSPQTETTSYAVTTTGTYYVVVDSWDVGSYGPYALTITIQ